MHLAILDRVGTKKTKQKQYYWFPKLLLTATVVRKINITIKKQHIQFYI